MENKGYLTPTIKLSLWFLFACFLWAILFPVYARFQENLRPVSCQSNLKQIGFGTFQYLQDYDERFPLVAVHDAGISATRPLGWADALQPYLKSTQIFQCHSQKSEEKRTPNETGYTDYRYNARLNGLEAKELEAIKNTFLHGDGNDGTDATNARYSLNELPSGWPAAKRHLDGANYSFTDGHVKWLKPETVTTKPPNGKNATFAVK